MLEDFETPEWMMDVLDSLSPDLDNGFFGIEDFLGEHGLMDKFEESYGYRPCHNWLNFTTYVGFPNEFAWHDELGNGFKEDMHTHEGDKVRINWIRGAEGCGGELSYLAEDDMIVKIPFSPNKMITVEMDTMHYVHPYYDRVTPRITLNTTWYEK